LYDARKALLGEAYNKYSGHSDKINSIEFVPGTMDFFSGGSDGTILLHSLRDTNRSYELIAETNNLFHDLELSPDGKNLLAATNTAGIYVYNMDKLKDQPAVLFGHEGKSRKLESSNDPEIFYSIGLDKKILRWSIPEGTSSELARSDSRYNDIACSPDGKILAACDRSGKIYIINLDQEVSSDTIELTESNPIFSLDFSPDGNYMAAGDMRGNVRIIETSTWTQQTSLRGSSARIESVSFSPEGKYLASSSYDGNVLMWDMEDLNNSPIVMEDNRGFVLTVGFSPDEQYILSGSESLVARPVVAGMLSDGICGMLHRNFTREEWENYIGADIPYFETCSLLLTEK
jgi:WD40 repeat protein